MADHMEYPSKKEGMKLSADQDFSVFDHLLEGCQVIDRDWRYSYVNDAVLTHARLRRDELIGRTMMEVYPGIENTEMFASLKVVMQTGQPQRIENKFVYPDGKIGWFILSLQPAPQGVLILSYEITKRKLLTEQMTLQRDRLSTLRQIDLAMNSTTDLDMVIGFILDQVIRIFKIDASQVLLYDERNLMLESYQQRGFNAYTEAGYKVRVGEGIAGKTALDRSTFRYPAISADIDATEHGRLLRENQFVCCISTPLLYNGKLVGLLEAYHRSQKSPDDEWVAFFETVAGQAAMAIDNLQHINHLEKSNLELELAYDQVVDSWAHIMVLRGCDLEGHNHRVMFDCIELAIRMDYKEEELVHIRRGALLHDIGLLIVPRAILCKRAPLDDEEWMIIHKHPTTAVEMLSRNPMLKRALDIPQYHHEWWDGSGYPYGLAGDLIPEPARIFAVVDVWDSLRSDRPYREKWSDEQALAHIISEAGSHFDPRVVEVFRKYLER